MRKKLGECLIQAGLITQEDLRVALDEQSRTGERLGAVLVRLNFATEKQVTKVLAHQSGVPFVSLTDDPPERSAIVLIPKDVAIDQECIALRLDNNVLTVATADPVAGDVVHHLELLTGRAIRRVVATRSDILESIASGYPLTSAAIIRAEASRGIVEVPPSVDVARQQEIETEAPPLALTVLASVESANHLAVSDAPAADHLLEHVIQRAIASGASDVHIDPRKNGAVIRHRVDGLLTEPFELPAWSHEALVSRIKELGLATDGRALARATNITISLSGREVEFRAFTLRTLFGEKIVLRLLGLRRAPMPLEELGLSATAMETVRAFLRHPHGLILIAGPSASGKTTTLASAITSFNHDAKNVVSIEQATQYYIPGINQMRVEDGAASTLAATISAVLEQDPDVLLIDDLDSSDAIEVAVRAAHKRQLVLASIHADNASLAVTRLLSTSVESHVIASALTGVIAQRLVRRLCGSCRRQYTPDAETLRALSIPESTAAEMVFYHAVGCDECHHTGYKGRIAIFEVMTVSDKVRQLISQKASDDLLRETAVGAGMVPLREESLAKVKAGSTTTDELLRVVSDVRDLRFTCPKCATAVGVDFNVCPQCAHRLTAACQKCGRALQEDWEYCPFCAAATSQKKKKKDQKTHDSPVSNVAEFKNQNR